MNSAKIMPLNPPIPGFKESIIRCFRKYATFRGRATRAEYWWFSLFGTLLGLVVHAVLQHLLGTKAAEESMGFVLLALFLPIDSRRNNRGHKSGIIREGPGYTGKTLCNFIA